MQDVIIGVNGYKESGKTTYVEAIVARCIELGVAVEVLPFAEPLKRLAREEFGWDGVKDAKGRLLLKTLGTEAGRAYDLDIWLKKWAKRAHGSDATVIIADDVRFDNEVDLLHAMPSAQREVLRIVKIGQVQDDEHATEAGITTPDREIAFEDGDLDGIEAHAEAYTSAILRRAGVLPEDVPIENTSGGVRSVQVSPPGLVTISIKMQGENGYEGTVSVDGRTLIDALRRCGLDAGSGIG